MRARYSKILIPGAFDVFNVEQMFVSAGRALGHEMVPVDARAARGNRFLAKLCWWMLDKRPVHLKRFSQKVVRRCLEQGIQVLLTTGMAPVCKSAIQLLRREGTCCVQYMTDDPWNRGHSASFYRAALPAYNTIFSTKRAVINDLLELGCNHVEYLPFAYCSEIHYREEPATDLERERFKCDVAYIGGADQERAESVRALVKAGFNVKLYGGFWEPYSDLKGISQGFLKGRHYRLAVASATVNIIYGRKANRDQHAMRSFEIPAMGAAIVAEDTSEHRDIFGADGQAVLYYQDNVTLVSRVKELLMDQSLQASLTAKSTEIMHQGGHSYEARLKTLLSFC